jgi:hypothetical protein
MKNIAPIFSIISSLVFMPPAWCDDLNDGISIDNAIADTNKSLQLSPNISYINQHAKMKANNGTAIVNGCQGTGNINVIGNNIKNITVVNASNNKNSTTICNQKQTTSSTPQSQQSTPTSDTTPQSQTPAQAPTSAE